MLTKPDSCFGCPLHHIGQGFSHPVGTGEKGVLVIAEALGEQEAAAGQALVGKAGHYLFNSLKRVGIEREDLALFNAIACRPPDNKLAGMSYESTALSHCAPNLDRAIHHYRGVAAAHGRTFVIVTLGRIAFKRVLGLDDKRHDRLLKSDYLCYPLWSEDYQAWVIAADHPAYLMRGNHHLLSILQFAFQRAMEIAEHGLTLTQPSYLLDPDVMVFSNWVDGYFRTLAQDPENTFLSYDIETPFKRGADEAEVAKEDDDDYTILRCAFAYEPGNAASVPWRAEYLPSLRRIFSQGRNFTGWNCPTPDQRVLTADLRWVTAGELREGDDLVGFDEHVPEGRKIRRYTASKVTHASRGVSRVLQVTFSDGSTVRVTGEHPWLVTQRNRTSGLRNQGGSDWVITNDLKVGQSIDRLLDTWTTRTDRESGYLAGFFDGEGHLSYSNNSLRVGAAQNHGATLDYVLKLLSGTELRAYSPRREKDSRLTNLVFAGVNGAVKFLGSIRPQRLLAKFTPEMMNSIRVRTEADQLTITAIDDLGEQEIVRLSTSTKTYVLEGFAAHNSNNYDDPRVHAQTPMREISIDAMLAWHVLNSALPKGLGFVTPFYVQDTSMWKHLSEVEPAFYNAKDADMALQNWLGIRRDLKANGQLWNVFNKHVIEMNRVFGYMRDQGVRIDLAARQAAEERLQLVLDGVEAQIEAVVPTEARSLKVYKKTPKDTAGLIQVKGETNTKMCSVCGTFGVKADHFKSIGKKRLKAGEPENHCHGGFSVKQKAAADLWARPEPFKLSNVSLQRYQKVVKHHPIVDPKRKVITFDEKAMLRLKKQHPKDALYPLVGEFRKYQKLLSTYVGVSESVEVPDGYQLHPGEEWVD